MSVTVADNEFDPLLFGCPHCKRETEAHMLVDRRDVGSGCTWVVCDECPRAWDGGMWELEDVVDKVRVA